MNGKGIQLVCLVEVMKGWMTASNDITSTISNILKFALLTFIISSMHSMCEKARFTAFSFFEWYFMVFLNMQRKVVIIPSIRTIELLFSGGNCTFSSSMWWKRDKLYFCTGITVVLPSLTLNRGMLSWSLCISKIE